MRNEVLPIYHGKRNFIGVKDLVVSLYTQKCQFSCSFCSLPTRSSESSVRDQNIIEQIDFVLEHYSEELDSFEQLSVGNEGSILDRVRFPDLALEHLLQNTKKMARLRVLSLETRPEYIKEEHLDQILQRVDSLQIDITCGFETQSDYIRNTILRKNIDRRKFEAKVALLGRKGIRFTSYILLKPDPTMTEEEGIQEAVATIKYLKEICVAFQVPLIVYLNPTYVAKDSELAKQMEQVGYTTPTLQSVFQTISEAKQFVVPIYVGLWSEGLAVSDNNNISTDIKQMRRTLREFNSTQDYSLIASYVR